MNNINNFLDNIKYFNYYAKWKSLKELRMAQDWFELIKFTNNEDFLIEKIRLKHRNITVEGEFELSLEFVEVNPPAKKTGNK